MQSEAVVAGLLVSLALGLAASWGTGSILMRGRRANVAPAKLPARDVTFQTKDHLSITATFTPGRDDHSPAVLLLHGVGSSRQATVAHAAWLAELGYATLAIDFRGHGQSDLAPRTFGLHESRDASAAFDWLKNRQNAAPVAVIGFSLGGAASLIGDEGPLPAEALILLAVYPDIRRAIRNRISSVLSIGPSLLLEPLLSFQAPLRFGFWPSRLSPMKSLSQYQGPVLIIGGEEDRSTPPEESRAMLSAVKGEGELFLVPHGDHAAICDLVDPTCRARIQAFLERVMACPI